jgi:hypothetical protein
MKKKFEKYMKKVRKYFKQYEFTKNHFYYTSLILIIMLLSVFLFNNYNKCTVYEVEATTNDFSINNGLLVVTKDDTVLKLSDISYKGGIQDAVYIEVGLYVLVDSEYHLINNFSSTSSEGFNLSDYLDKVKFDISENNNNIDIFTNSIKDNIVNNLYLKIKLTSVDGKTLERKIKLNSNSLYRNVKLFY